MKEIDPSSRQYVIRRTFIFASYWDPQKGDWDSKRPSPKHRFTKQEAIDTLKLLRHHPKSSGLSWDAEPAKIIRVKRVPKKARRVYAIRRSDGQFWDATAAMENLNRFTPELKTDELMTESEALDTIKLLNASGITGLEGWELMG